MLAFLCSGTVDVVPNPFLQTDPFDNRAVNRDRSDRHIQYPTGERDSTLAVVMLVLPYSY